jgi:hypothetical protein
MSITYKKCPKCNGANIVPIAYGEPTYETCLESEEGKCVLGGCLIEVDEDGKNIMDQYHCIDCGYEYNKSKVIDVIYSKIASIKGYVGGYSQGHQYFEINLLTGEVFYSKEFNGELDFIKMLNENQIDKLLKDLKAINILTWKKKYIDQDILDGTQWNVTIDVDGRKREKIGCNIYPKEWNLYCKIISKILKEDFS